MTEKILRDVLKEAQKQKQLGLFIWGNHTLWDGLAFEMKPENETFAFAIYQICQGKESFIWSDWNGTPIPGAIAVPLHKLISSEKFFAHILHMCEEGQYEGPITLVPANKLSKFC